MIKRINNLWSILKKFLTNTSVSRSIDNAGIVMTIREIILKELRRRKWSHYRLVKELEGKIPPTTIYEYLSGKSDIGTERVSIILQLLGLQIKRKP